VRFTGAVGRLTVAAGLALTWAEFGLSPKLFAAETT
jgi:hypothetical protein